MFYVCVYYECACMIFANKFVVHIIVLGIDYLLNCCDVPLLPIKHSQTISVPCSIHIQFLSAVPFYLISSVWIVSSQCDPQIKIFGQVFYILFDCEILLFIQTQLSNVWCGLLISIHKSYAENYVIYRESCDLFLVAIRLATSEIYYTNLHIYSHGYLCTPTHQYAWNA